jgi:predicted O-linked N-acetylglucosamine transferase (SPINDLY family)
MPAPAPPAPAHPSSAIVLADRAPIRRSLAGMDTVAAAGRIAADGVDVLIELNGHTLRSGLPVLAMRPAPVQASFLGYSLSTAVPQVCALTLVCV